MLTKAFIQTMPSIRLWPDRVTPAETDAKSYLILLAASKSPVTLEWHPDSISTALKSCRLRRGARCVQSPSTSCGSVYWTCSKQTPRLDVVATL